MSLMECCLRVQESLGVLSLSLQKSCLEVSGGVCLVSVQESCLQVSPAVFRSLVWEFLGVLSRSFQESLGVLSRSLQEFCLGVSGSLVQESLEVSKNLQKTLGILSLVLSRSLRGGFYDYSFSSGPFQSSLETSLQEQSRTSLSQSRIESLDQEMSILLALKSFRWWVVGGCFLVYSVSFGPKSKSFELEKCIRQRPDVDLDKDQTWTKSLTITN